MMTGRDILPQTNRAYELYGDFWFNSEPVPIAAMRGRVVLIHFWDYTSIGSLRTLPYVKEWQRKYEHYGLVTVGVHTPQFGFGKDPENVERAIRRLGIHYPVVMDNEALLASRYGSQRWPTTFLIDKDGFVRYQASGEGNYAGTEHALQTLLYHAGVGEELPVLMEPVRDADRHGAVFFRGTPDLLTGYARGSIGNIEGYHPESLVGYEDPGVYLHGRFYLDGPWMNSKESIRFDGTDGHVVIEYEAQEVAAVLEPGTGGPVRASITQDGRPLDAVSRGDDVRGLADGTSSLTIDEPRLYSLVRNREHGGHVVRLDVRTRGLSIYAFGFVAGIIPELISNS